MRACVHTCVHACVPELPLGIAMSSSSTICRSPDACVFFARVGDVNLQVAATCVQRRLSAVPYTVFPNLKSNKDRLQRSPRTRACARTCSLARRAPACRSRCGCHTCFCKPARGFTAVLTHGLSVLIRAILRTSMAGNTDGERVQLKPSSTQSLRASVHRGSKTEPSGPPLTIYACVAFLSRRPSSARIDVPA